VGNYKGQFKKEVYSHDYPHEKIREISDKKHVDTPQLIKTTTSQFPK
jgi:hypothetical protein